MSHNKDLLAIFDLDSTLVDTDAVNYAAYSAALNKFGFSLLQDDFHKYCIGKSASYFLPKLTNSNDAALLSKIHAYKLQIYSQYLDKSILNKHVVNLLNSMSVSYHIALVTSASAKNCMEMIEFHKLTACFELVITRDDVTKPKPSPEPFLKAMQYFDTIAKNTIIFEDSPTGVQAAHATGANVIVVQPWHK